MRAGLSSYSDTGLRSELVWVTPGHTCVLCQLHFQAVTRRLTHLATEVLAAKQRSKALTAESPGMATPGNTGGIGSVEHTLKVSSAAGGSRIQPCPAMTFALQT